MITKKIGIYTIVNKGYNNKIYKGSELIAEFTDTIVGAISYVNKLNNQ